MLGKRNVPTNKSQKPCDEYDPKNGDGLTRRGKLKRDQRSREERKRKRTNR